MHSEVQTIGTFLELRADRGTASLKTPGQNFLKKLTVPKKPLSSAQFEGRDQERIASVLEGQAAWPSFKMMFPRRETFDLKNSHLERVLFRLAS